MHRRDFIASSVSAAVAATVVGGAAAVAPGAAAQSAGAATAERALSALKAAKQLEARGLADRLRDSFHSDALLVEPSTLQPSLGRAAITESLRKAGQQRKLLYFYYRQPQVLLFGNNALVVSNYEAGYSSEGRTVEDSGKATYVVMLGPNPPLIGAEVLVPNLYAGSYGSLGTALSQPRFGHFPLRALGQAKEAAAASAGGGENDVILKQVRRIHEAWVAGDTEGILKFSNRSGVFLIGDYSPFYITGTEEVRQHFADFYRTSKVNYVRELDPTVRIWGNTAAISFNFDLDYSVNNRTGRSPGRGVYVFTRTGAAGSQWAMAACTASHLVARNIGDPYPLPGL
jgi:Domain of unknown function (DUF4440)